MVYLVHGFEGFSSWPTGSKAKKTVVEGLGRAELVNSWQPESSARTAPEMKEPGVGYNTQGHVSVTYPLVTWKYGLPIPKAAPRPIKCTSLNFTVRKRPVNLAKN